jgi:ABC-type nitrate/sulfonate/bicarbonate transport system permease component
MATVDRLSPRVGTAEAPAVPADVRIPGRKSALARREPLLVGLTAVVVFLIVWQAVAWRRLVPELFLPGPTDIFAALGGLFGAGTIWRDLWVSGQELIYGYVLAIVIALPLGLLMGWYKRVGYAVDPFVAFFYSTPRIVLVPLLIIWFGIGIYSKIAVVFLGAVFPMIVSTMSGVRNVDGSLIKAARSFGASDMQLFRTVVLPGAVPFVLTGLRLGIGHALTGVVVGELVAAQAGIGLMMATAGSTFQTSKVFAGMFIIAGSGIALTLLLQKIEQRFQSWKTV